MAQKIWHLHRSQGYYLGGLWHTTLLHTCFLCRLVALQCWRKRNKDLHERPLVAWAVQRALGVFIRPSGTKAKNALLLGILESLVRQLERNEKQRKTQMLRIKDQRHQINFDERDGSYSHRSLHMEMPSRFTIPPREFSALPVSPQSSCP